MDGETYGWMDVWMYGRMDGWMHKRTLYIYMCVCLCTRASRQTNIRTYVRTYIHTYIHTYLGGFSNRGKGLHKSQLREVKTAMRTRESQKRARPL